MVYCILTAVVQRSLGEALRDGLVDLFCMIPIIAIRSELCRVFDRRLQRVDKNAFGPGQPQLPEYQKKL